MINIINKQKKIIISEQQIIKMGKKMLSVLDYDDFDVAIWFTTNATIRKYNKKYRNKDEPTDILSFPFHEDLEMGQRIVVNSDDDKNLGDIVISLEYVQKQTLAPNISVHDHLKVLIAHGIVHLLNYDHKTEEDFLKMNQLEEILISK
jgi:probable rRNA maturation factor